MRKPVAVIMATALLAALAGCAGGAGSSSDCTPLAENGDASSVVSATGEFGSRPQVEFPRPLIAETTERSVLVRGEGRLLQKNDVAVGEISLLDGANGEVLQETSYDGTGGSLLGINTSQAIGIERGLACARVGDRVAIVIPNSEGFSDAQKGTIVLVMDVVAGYPGRSTAPAAAAPNGFPNVVYGENGRPGIEIAGGTAPTEFKVATLRQGDGPTVEEGQFLLVQYTAVNWNTRKVFQSTWDVGRPGTAVATSGQTLAEGAFPGLVGQKVGSQYVAVIPPAQGFGSQASAEVPANSSFVWVVDILGVLPSP